jgi:hypothetical protein
MPDTDPQDEPLDGEIVENTAPTVAKHPAPYSKRSADTLTHKQSLFVDAILAGKGPSEAFRLAYDTSKMNPATIAQRAYDLCHKHGNVKAIIAAHKLKKQQKSLLNRSIIEEKLYLNAERAAGNQTQKLKMLRNGEVQEVEAHFLDRSAANTGYIALGKEHGMFIDRREVGTPGEFARLDDAQLNASIAELLAALKTGD